MDPPLVAPLMATLTSGDETGPAAEEVGGLAPWPSSSMGAGGIIAFESGANPVGVLTPYGGGPVVLPAPHPSLIALQ